VEISTLRWTIASFCGGVCLLALASVPLVAVCAGAGSASFRHAAVAAVVVAAVCLLAVVVALDLLGARARRSALPQQRAPSRARTRVS
jgi:hypothetical protein